MRQIKMKTLFSIGYQGRSMSEFCSLLEEHAVKVLIDVRERAWSHRPEYRKNALKVNLQNSGIEYIHYKMAGNPYRPRKDEDLDLARCSKLYQQHLNNNPTVVQYLSEFALKNASAFFCYEAERKNCHRGILIENLIDKNPGFKCIDI
jgi:uncharacterized protein (DUF488 family)